MTCVQDKQKVSIAYIVRDMSRKILEEIPESKPFMYIHGFGNIIPGLENALTNRQVGEKFSVTIGYNEGYGPFRNDLIIEVPKDELKDVGELWIGMELEMYREGDLSDFQVPEYPEDILGPENDEENGQPELYTIKEIRETTVLMDGNHPFAGMDLIFEVTVVAVEDPSFTELESGMPDEDSDTEGDCGNEDFDNNSRRHWF